MLMIAVEELEDAVAKLTDKRAELTEEKKIAELKNTDLKKSLQAKEEVEAKRLQ